VGGAGDAAGDAAGDGTGEVKSSGGRLCSSSATAAAPTDAEAACPADTAVAAVSAGHAKPASVSAHASAIVAAGLDPIRRAKSASTLISR
jgi:hypothetical protein